MTSRALVTGGAGFIGSHLADQLIAEGHSVTVLDDFSTGCRENLSTADENPLLRVIDGSILDQSAVERAIEGCDIVYHLAVQCVRRSLENPIGNHDVNSTGTLMVLEAARRHKVQRFIYCSSSEVYGNCGVEWLSEETTLCVPATVYGAAKLAGEHYARAYWETYRLPSVVVRPFNAYGPRAHETGDLAEVIPRFLIRVLNGLPPVIFGSGANGRDFTYVTDTARGIAIAGRSESLVGRTVNIACGRMITIAEVAQMIADRCERPELRPITIEPRPGDVLRLQADTRVAQEVIGFQPLLDFDEGLRRYITWFRARHNDVSALREDDVRNWRMPAA
jgi:UDP-glucose 4-epimerase